MRCLAVVLVLPLAGCLTAGTPCSTDHVVGDEATYEFVAPGSNFWTPTIRQATDSWMGGRDFWNGFPTALSTQTIRVTVQEGQEGFEIAYRNGTGSSPFAVEHVASNGALVGVSQFPDSGHWTRLDGGGLPHLLGSAWAGGDARSWTAHVRAHDFEPATNATMAMDVTWQPKGCGGHLKVGPGSIDGEPTKLWNGWRTTYDDSPWPMRFEVMDNHVAPGLVLERISVHTGSGAALPMPWPESADPLATVDIHELLTQKPPGFLLSLSEALDELAMHPVAAVYMLQHPDAEVRAFAHGPMDAGDVWFVEFHEPGDDQILAGVVRSGAGAPLVSSDLRSVGGDWPVIEDQVVSLDALAAWHPAVDSIWCDPNMFRTCVFGSAGEVAFSFDDDWVPGSVTGKGFSSGYRVNLHHGVVGDVKHP